MKHDYGRTLTLLGWLVAAGLTACGGATVSTTGGGGLSGTGVVAARGTITGFGSVIVNGTEFFTDTQTAISVNGATTSETALSIGMVVDLTATDDGSRITADTISYAGDLRGPVESVDPGAGTLTVLGQTVDARTAHLEGHTTLDDFTPGEIVELSGHRATDGRWKASFLQVESDPDEEGIIQLEGKISFHDPTAHTFFLGSQRVDYDGIWMNPGGMMTNGQEVRIRSTTGFVDGTLMADEITFEEGVTLPGDGGYMDLEGFVTDIVDATTFSVDGTPVDASNASFRGGTSADLALDVEVEVEGYIQNGMFVAEFVEFEDD